MPVGKQTSEFPTRIIPVRKTQHLAQRLAKLDKFQFQHWALLLIDARPLTEGEGKCADRGVDSLLYFYESRDEQRKIIVQVKGGGVKRGDVAT
jgi:hypothetical protein